MGLDGFKSQDTENQTGDNSHQYITKGKFQSTDRKIESFSVTKSSVMQPLPGSSGPGPTKLN